MKVKLKSLTEQANGLGQLLFEKYGKAEGSPELPEWAKGLMDLLCRMEHSLFVCDEIKLEKVKEQRS